MFPFLCDVMCIFFYSRKKFPDVSQHMASLDIPWALIATKWFICLFAEVLPIEVGIYNKLVLNVFNTNYII